MVDPFPTKINTANPLIHIETLQLYGKSILNLVRKSVFSWFSMHSCKTRLNLILRCRQQTRRIRTFWEYSLQHLIQFPRSSIHSQGHPIFAIYPNTPSHRSKNV